MNKQWGTQGDHWTDIILPYPLSKATIQYKINHKAVKSTANQPQMMRQYRNQPKKFIVLHTQTQRYKTHRKPNANPPQTKNTTQRGVKNTNLHLVDAPNLNANLQSQSPTTMSNLQPQSLSKLECEPDANPNWCEP